MKPHRLSISVWALGLAAVLSGQSWAELRLNRYFTDHMVLQRDAPLTIRGAASADAEVQVAFAGRHATTAASSEGRWTVTLDPVAAQLTPQTLTVTSGTERITLEDILVGDVILHARQSAIDLTLSRDQAGRDVAAAHEPSARFRAIRIDAIPAEQAQEDLAAKATEGWRVVDATQAARMSASGYEIGRGWAAQAEVPIGMVDLHMGDGFGNSWLSREALMETGRYYRDAKKDRPDKQVAEAVLRYERYLECEKQGIKFWHGDAGPPTHTLQRPLYPAGRYHGTLHPLRGAAFSAVLLQLGNDYPYRFYNDLAASEHPFDPDQLDLVYKQTYHLRKSGFAMEPKVIPRIVTEWRRYLGDEELPFGWIMPPGSDLNTLAQHHREMRELQRRTAEELDGVGLILPGTEHIPFSAQPADEALLAQRCLAWLRGTLDPSSGQPTSGPAFDRFEAEYNTATVHFKTGTAEGLQAAAGTELDGFEAAGVEGDYVPARAAIDGETVRLVADGLSRITRIRYGWERRPRQNLQNAADLPAIPFRSEVQPYHWLVRNDVEEVPVEYTLPADQWPKSDVTLFNMKTTEAGFTNFSGWIGPAGFRTSPFGPNMRVTEVLEGSPAAGRVQVGDTIFRANGRLLGEKSWEVMAAAVTESETPERRGQLLLGLRRGARVLEIELELEVLGSYSPTAPYQCPKTEKVIQNLVDHLVREDTDGGFLHSAALYLLATGDPEVLGYVRRAVYQILEEEIQPGPLDGRDAGKSWYNSADALLLGEYYLATGDRQVLAHLKYACDKLAAMQQPEGGWRHNYPGGSSYGYISVAGMPGVMGMHMAKLAGVAIDEECYELGLRHYQRHRAETGQIIYGVGNMYRPVPVRFDPELVLHGKMDSMNGAVSAGGILMDFIDDHRSSHLCSAISAYAYNNTHGGHGGNFWNNFWTPLGASFHSRDAFIHFEKNYRWYRELGRMPDGMLTGGGRPSAGYGVALLVPRQRLRITGARNSPFEDGGPAALVAARDAYWRRDYAAAQRLGEAVLAQADEWIGRNELERADLPVIEKLVRAAREMQASIEADLGRVAEWIAAGRPRAAQSFLPGLAGVMAADDPRLAAVQERLGALTAAMGGGSDEEPAEEVDRIALDLARIREMVERGDIAAAQTYITSVIDGMGSQDERLLEMRRQLERKEEATEEIDDRTWETLVIDRQFDGAGTFYRERGGREMVTRLEKPTRWRLRVVEAMRQAPAGWEQPGFDDSDWPETDLPTSWHLYHTGLLRTKFHLEDKSRYDAVGLHAWVLWQQEVEIYLNGTLVGKVSGAERRTTLQDRFKDSILEVLKDGENTIAIKSRSNWRWGHRDFRVYNGGFDFNLDARLKEGLTVALPPQE